MLGRQGAFRIRNTLCTPSSKYFVLDQIQILKVLVLQFKRILSTMCRSYKSQIFAAALACFASVSAATSVLAQPKTFLPTRPTAIIRRSEAKDVMYQLRGGAGPLDAVDTAKAGSVVALVSGVLHSVSAGKMLEAYGSARTPILELCLRNIGASILGVAIPPWCLINGKCVSTNTAVGLSILPWIVTTLKAVVDGDSDSVKTNPQLFVLLYDVFTAHALFTDAGYATQALQAFCVWVLANGVFLAMSPKGAATSWGGNADPQDQVVSMTKTNGFGLLSYGVFVYALSQDVDVAKSFGYSLVPWLFDNVSRNFVTKEVEKYGQASGPQMFWLVYFIVVIASTAF